MTEIVVLPVSGGGFVAQIVFLTELFKACPTLRPRTFLASSGGNIAAYLAVISSHNPDYMIELACQISARDYIEKSGLSPLWRLLLRGYAYHNSRETGFLDLITKPTIEGFEIWTGCFNRQTHSAELFCSAASGKTVLVPRDNYEGHDIDSPVVRYLDGDVDYIRKAVRASTNIPVLLPSVEIDGQHYSDGGSFSASPLTCIRRTIKALGSYHLIYISSENLDSPPHDMNVGQLNVINTAASSIDQLIRSLKTSDRRIAIELSDRQIALPVENLAEYYSLRRRYQRTVLELYPSVTNQVDILNFTGEDVKNCMNLLRPNLRARLWV